MKVVVNQLSEYDICESVKSLGKLVPVLKDKFGNVIDGLHRLEMFPDWPCVTIESIDTLQKLEAARLAVNVNRRVVLKSEIDLRVELLAKSGLKADEIASMSGLALSTVYKHFPQGLKDAGKVEAGRVGGSALRVEQTGSTPERGQPIRVMPCTDLLECDGCKMATHITKLATLNGEDLCPICYQRRLKFPKAELKSPEPQSKPTESWTQRKAIMSPQHSKLEVALAVKLQAMGLAFETDRNFCLQSTIPDYYFDKQKVAVYLDGPVHAGREDHDEVLRDLLTKRYGIRVVTVKNDGESAAELDRLAEVIRKEVTF